MILVDSSIWIDHLRDFDEALTRLLERQRVLVHPFIIGEVALGHLRQRASILSQLEELPVVRPASFADVTRLIERQQLFGLGLGYVDVHLLTSTLITADAALWTRDKRLRAVADRLGVAADVD